MNRNNIAARSVIDYIIIEQENETKTLKITIDEECIYPIKNEDHREKDGTIRRGKQTDHNTITMVWDTTVQIQTGKTQYGKKVQKKNGKHTTNTYKSKRHTHTHKTYDELEMALKQAITKTKQKQ